MAMGLQASYCAMCNSHSCRHALQLNEHNMRMQRDRMQAGMISHAEMIFGVSGTANPIQIQESGIPHSKKLLLLRGSGK